jgi:micrococcal nuclease
MFIVWKNKHNRRNALTIAVLISAITFGITVMFSSIASTASSPMLSGTVAHIVDGDTVDISVSQCRAPWKGDSQLCRVRLACIDTPERGQNPFFQDASNRIEALIPVGTKVSLRDTGDTSYNRIVGEIFKNNQSINLQMVRDGKGAVFCKYLDSCRNTKTSYLNAELSARREGLGIWNRQQPWTQSREQQPCSAS